MNRPCRSMCTVAGMEARAISSNVLALMTSMNGGVLGSEEMTEDRMTPEGMKTQAVRTREEETPPTHML